MRKFTRLSLLLSLSIVLNIIEDSIPIFNGLIPGLKLGLANIVILFVLFTYSFKEAFYVSVLRVILVGILRGLFGIAFFFSIGGSIFSIIAMYISKKITKLSIIGVSIIGSIFHSIGQIIISIFIIKTTAIIFYLPWLLLFSIPTGIITGMVAKKLLESLDEIFQSDQSYHV